MINKILIGNWKMALGLSESHQLAKALADNLLPLPKGLKLVVCPSFPALSAVGAVLSNVAALGAQNAHWEEVGAFTGEVAVSMLKELNCQYVIIGHSERRQHLGETDQTVNIKVRACLGHGLTPIICVGETAAERQKKITDKVVTRQLKAALKGIELTPAAALIIAYEPRWAIGTGDNCDPKEAVRVHFLLRELLKRLLPVGMSFKIIYGGSVAGKNIKSYWREPEIEGALVGGASQTAEGFLALVKAVST